MELANAYFFVSGKIMKENILPTHTQQSTLYSRINAYLKMIEENKNASKEVVTTDLADGLEWNSRELKTDLFQSCGHC